MGKLMTMQIYLRHHSFQGRIHFFLTSVTFIELQEQMALVTQKITRDINFRQNFSKRICF